MTIGASGYALILENGSFLLLESGDGALLIEPVQARPDPEPEPEPAVAQTGHSARPFFKGFYHIPEPEPGPQTSAVPSLPDQSGLALILLTWGKA